MYRSLVSKTESPSHIRELAEGVRELGQMLAALNHHRKPDPQSSEVNSRQALVLYGLRTQDKASFTNANDGSNIIYPCGEADFKQVLAKLQTALLEINNMTISWKEERWSKNTYLTKSLRRAFRAMEGHLRHCVKCALPSLDHGDSDGDGRSLILGGAMMKEDYGIQQTLPRAIDRCHARIGGLAGASNYAVAVSRHDANNTLENHEWVLDGCGRN